MKVRLGEIKFGQEIKTIEGEGTKKESITEGGNLIEIVYGIKYF